MIIKRTIKLRPHVEITLPESVSPTKLAAELGVDRQRVWNWKKRKSIPDCFIERIEAIPLKTVKRD